MSAKQVKTDRQDTKALNEKRNEKKKKFNKKSFFSFISKFMKIHLLGEVHA